MAIRFLKNVKYQGKIYSVGQILDVENDDLIRDGFAEVVLSATPAVEPKAEEKIEEKKAEVVASSEEVVPEVKKKEEADLQTGSDSVSSETTVSSPSSSPEVVEVVQQHEIPSTITLDPGNNQENIQKLKDILSKLEQKI